MIDKMRELLFKIFKRESFLGKLVDKFFTREIITYIIFGVLTTAVNLVTFYIFKKIFISIGWEGVFNKLLGSAGWDKALELLGSGTDYLDATVIAWTVAVIFAFVTNKLIVFESKSWKPPLRAKNSSASSAQDSFRCWSSLCSCLRWSRSSSGTTSSRSS